LSVQPWPTSEQNLKSQGQFVIHRVGLAKINSQSKFEVSMFTHYEDMKGNAKCKNWVGLMG